MDSPAATVKVSRYSYSETVERLAQAIAAAGNTVFAMIDQASAASAAGLSLRPTTLILFGNPKGGTPLMDAAPLFALDLPLKLLVWEENGAVRVAHVSMERVAGFHGVANQAARIAAMDRALEALSDSVV